MKRFIAVQEPTCTWAVFDIVDDVPAELGGVVLVGLEQAEAMTFASLANSRQAPRTRELRIAGTGLRLVVARAALRSDAYHALKPALGHIPAGQSQL